MGRRVSPFTALLLLAGGIATAFTCYAWAADETSSGDKLRILYSSGFQFQNDGLPRLTVEIFGGQDRIELHAQGGLDVLPDGLGGAQVRGQDGWTIELRDATPARVREWIVVERLDPEQDRLVEKAITRWRKRGHLVESFDIGTVFGVEGIVVDQRRTLIAIDPAGAGEGGRNAAAIARRYGVTTSVHIEMVERPRGTIVAKSGGMEISNQSVLWFAPHRRDHTIRVSDVVVGGGGSQLETHREDRSYFGQVYITIGRDGKLTAVNAVAADRLLAGLVPSEIFPTAHSEALAAQAVAARTELIQKIGTRHLADPFLLCSTQHCQVYSGAGREHPRTTSAVEKTRGLVLIGRDEKLVDARYSASCGGHGEHNEHIWGGEPDPSLRGHIDAPKGSELARRYASGIDDSNLESFLSERSGAYCAATRYGKGRFRWRAQISTDDLSARVAAHYPNVGRVHKLAMVRRGVSGRGNHLRIFGSRGRADVHGDLAIRRLLGGLKSSLFTIKPVGPGDQPRAFEFHGAGFGHGVGMCQVGAIGMAENRNQFRAILQHYYAGSVVRRLY